MKNKLCSNFTIAYRLNFLYLDFPFDLNSLQIVQTQIGYAQIPLLSFAIVIEFH